MSDPPKSRARLRRAADRGLLLAGGAASLGLLLLLWFAIVRSSTAGAGWLAPGAVALALAAVVGFLAVRRRLYARVPPERILILGVALLAPLVLIEVAANVANVRGYLYFARSQRYFQWQVYEGIPQSHAHPRESAISFPWGEVRTNREGWRAPERALEPAPKTLRVLALGDSVVFGWGVQEADTLCLQLETWLGSRLGRAPLEGVEQVEVINTGNGSYDSLDELLVFKERGLAYRPTIVYLLILGNDFERPPYQDQVDYLAQGKPHDPDLIATLRKTAIPRPPRAGPSGEPWRTLYASVSYLANRSFLVVSGASAARRLGSSSSSSESSSSSPAAGESTTSSPPAPPAAKTAAKPAPRVADLLPRFPYLREHVACLREVARTCAAAKIPLVMTVFSQQTPDLVAVLQAELKPLTPVTELTFPDDVAPITLVNSATDPHWNKAGNAWFAEQVGALLLEAARMRPR